jgi:chemotaxis protein methyltransferase CheR
MALRLAGIELFERHRESLERRSRRLGVHGTDAFDALLDSVECGDAGAWQRFIGLVTTKFTGFFRHPRHFDVAAGIALRAARRRGEARIWSAAAATGEEPYSLAIAAIEAFGRDDPPLAIVASDVDEGALSSARRGEYGDLALGSVDPKRRARFFVEVAGDERSSARRWRVAVAVRKMVVFRFLNLADAEWALEGPFDVILARNVLMYLAPEYRYAALERIVSMLAPGGVLILDPAEHLGKAAHMFADGSGGIHTLRARARGDAAAPGVFAPR